MTEWLGGTIIIRGREAYHTSQTLTPEEALQISSSAELGTNDGSGNRYIERL